MCGVETHAAVLHLVDGRAAKRFNDDAIIKTDAENARAVLWTRRKRGEKGREEKGKGGRRKERGRLLFAVIGVLFHAGAAGKALRRRRF